MNEICRLCCSDKYVNNDIFNEDNALYLKMSLYLPIKVFKNDRLPQKICDRCSCKVNDFYQFCNAAIEVQNRLHAILLLTPNTVLDAISLTGIKRDISPARNTKCEQSTQTEKDPPILDDTSERVEVKKEPAGSPVPLHGEDVKHELDHFADHHSDSSDDMCLLVLKNKKRTKNDIGGVDSYTPKKKTKYKHIGDILPSVPEDTALRLLPENVKLEVKEESEETGMVIRGALRDGGEALKEEVYGCCVCLAQCHSKAEMLKHYRQHEAQCRSALQPPAVPPPPDHHPLRCPRCRKVLSGGAGEWEAHWVRHWARDRKPLRCALCERSFADANSAFKHGLSHSRGDGGEPQEPQPQPRKRFVCDMCPQSFVFMRFLLAHRAREHPAECARPLALRCGECAREFAHLNSLRRHIRAHSGERNHLCNVCGKALSSREHLKFHIRIHTGYKPNVCGVCGKGFVKKCNLTLHERVHSGEKPHVCSHCGKAFSQRSTLVIHERYHSGARPYVCGLCGRGFVAKGLLSMHLKTTCI